MKQNLARWTPVFLGSGLGLFLSRTAAELQSEPWPLPTLALVILTSVILGLGLVFWARKRLNLAPLGLLWLYILWPSNDPLLATSIAILAIIAFLFLNLKPISSFWVDALIFFSSLAIYIYTLAPSVLPADSGEFQFVSYILGIAHPPGYPLYTLLGKLFTFIPVGDVAYRVNLFSAVIAAATLVLINRALRLVTGSSFAGVLGALVLGGSTTFWAQATTANIRMLNTFFATLILFAAVSYAHQKSQRGLILLAASIGLGITHHLSLLLIVPAVLVYLWLADREILKRSPRLIKAGLAFLASLLFLLYIPIRAWTGAPFGGEGLKTLPGVLRHILGLGFQGDIFFFATPELLPERFRILVNILDFQFGLLLLLAILASGLVLARANLRLFVLWGGTFLLLGFTGITYRAPQTVEYLLPAYIPLVLSLGYGAWWLGRQLSAYGEARAVLLSLLFLLGFWQAAAHYPSYRALSQDHATQEYAKEVLSQAPQGATVLANWHRTTALWYEQYVEGARPDVTVQYVFPRGEAPIYQTWQRKLGQSVEQAPTVATNYYPNFDTLPYRFWPLGEAFLVGDEPAFQAAEVMVPVNETFGETIRILGYRMIDTSLGMPITLDLFWQPLVILERDYSFFVHLVDEDGQVLGQMDLTHPQSRNYQFGEVLVDRYRIPVLPTVPEGRYRLIAGVYFALSEGGWRRLTRPGGEETVTLQEVDWKSSSQELITLNPMYQRFAGGLILSGVDYDLTIPGIRRVYLHWDKPVTLDEEFTFSLGWKEQIVAEGTIPPGTGKFLNLVEVLAEAWPLSLQVFPAEDTTKPLPSLGPWNFPLGQSVNLPGSGIGHYLDLGNEMLLTDVKLPQQALLPGQEFAIDLKLISLQPISNDYSFSIRLSDTQGRWQATAVEGSQTLGAIPTLKWIRGTVIYSRHILQMPADALPGKADLSLVVYDAFTSRTLPVLDARIAQQGGNIPLGQVEIAVR
ncbi:MAG: DUF2723 domain-containing protein [Chloroflexi bacterium]|nr:DUF2723 domain-containing protein [Chloroflexota bacterium]